MTNPYFQILESTKSAQNRDIYLLSINNKNFIDYNQNILIVGCFHGDEIQGKYLIEEYLNKNISSSLNNRLLFIPCLNPDGLSLLKRTNSNGVDLNRNFPTTNWGQDGSAAGENPSDYYAGSEPASEIETRFIIKIIKKYQPKMILTLHSPYKVVNYDGPALEYARRISEITGYPVEPSIGYPTPGSFGTYCGIERNIPIITLELDDKINIEELIPPIFEVFEYLKYCK